MDTVSASASPAWMEWRLMGRAYGTRQQCNATSKQSGRQCGQPAVEGGTKCRIHGGVGMPAVINPNFQTGKYSKYLPARLAERYDIARDDTELLSMREELALVDTRLVDVLSRVEQGDAPDTLALISDALRGGEIERARALAAGAAGDWAVWREVQSLVRERRALVESERKRLIELRQTVTVEQVMVLIGRLSALIERYVPDPATRAQIGRELRGVLEFR